MLFQLLKTLYTIIHFSRNKKYITNETHLLQQKTLGFVEFRSTYIELCLLILYFNVKHALHLHGK